MTAAVPLIHAFTVAVLTGIMAEQTGESDENGEGGGLGRGQGMGGGKAVGPGRGRTRMVHLKQSVSCFRSFLTQYLSRTIHFRSGTYRPCLLCSVWGGTRDNYALPTSHWTEG